MEPFNPATGDIDPDPHDWEPDTDTEPMDFEDEDAPSEPQYGTTRDGYQYDLETGEVCGMASQVPSVPLKETFVADTIEKVEWVLSKRMDAEIIVYALKVKLAAITENITSMITAEERKLTWLDARFGLDLREYAASHLTGKAKSVKTTYGTLAFRASAGSIKITDMAKAVEWANTNAPEAIKVTSHVVVTPLKDREGDLPTDCFTVTGPHESFSIKTGITK
jgi:phage host-nuclease inhibitor protein Gam